MTCNGLVTSNPEAERMKAWASAGFRSDQLEWHVRSVSGKGRLLGFLDFAHGEAKAKAESKRSKSPE